MSLIDHAPPVAELDADDGKPLRSIEKGLAILDAFEGDSALLGVSEIARRSGLPKSTAFRLTTSLEQKGYLERVGDRYRLGLRLFELGNMVSWCRPRRLRETALPFMCDLFRQTGKTVHLAVLDGTDVLYVEKLHGREQISTPSRVGGRVSARTTALGKAILAHSDTETVSRALSVAPRFCTSRAATPELFLKELDAVRRQGVAFDREEVRVGLTCVAAPILQRGQVLGALSLSGCAHTFDAEGLAQRVRHSAEGVAHLML